MPEINRHSPTALAAYHDLVSILLDDALSDIQGSPTLREINGRSYWYDRYRIGNEMHERYLGEDNPVTRERVDRFKALRQGQVNRRRERTRLVRLLRSERFLGMDGATGSLVAALARVGAFRLGGVRWDECIPAIRGRTGPEVEARPGGDDKRHRCRKL